jgi:hypothetical protein
MTDRFNSSGRSRRQRDLSDIPGFNHSRRSWTTNGMHVTMETATYAHPGFSIRSSGDGFNAFNNFLQPSRTRATRGGGGLLGGGLLGGAINMLNGVSNSQMRREKPTRRTERDVYLVESDDSTSDSAGSDDDLAYGSLPRMRAAPPQTVFGKLKDRILDHGRQHTNAASEEFVYEQPPPDPQHRHDTRSDRRRFRSKSPEPPRSNRQQRARTTNYDRTPESSPERPADIPVHTQNGRTTRLDREVTNLQRAVESERKQYLVAKTLFQQASQRSTIDAEYIQDLLNQVKLHGTLLASAQRKLQVAKEQQRHEATAQRTQPQPRSQPFSHRQSHYESDDDDDDEAFDDWSDHASTSRSNIPFQDPLRHTGAFDPLGGFRVFDHLFAEMDAAHSNANSFHFFAGPGGPSFQRTSHTNGRTPRGTNRSRQSSDSKIPQSRRDTQPAPRISSNPLRAKEASRLFEKYNSSWNSLAATFPTIPYPTRTLLAPALCDPSTIPHALSRTWSAEQVMQANTALFLLLALGFMPVISDTGLVTFDHLSVTEAQVKTLISVLKKEKLRWHSDRLGRRNEDIPGGGLNETLQRDERARAVFHGVCGLMEFTLGRAN